MANGLPADVLPEFCRAKLVCGEDACHVEVECDCEQQRDAFAKAFGNEVIIRVVPKIVTVAPQLAATRT